MCYRYAPSWFGMYWYAPSWFGTHVVRTFPIWYAYGTHLLHNRSALSTHLDTHLGTHQGCAKIWCPQNSLNHCNSQFKHGLIWGDDSRVEPSSNVNSSLQQQMGEKTCGLLALAAGFPLACNPATSQVQIWEPKSALRTIF